MLNQEPPKGHIKPTPRKEKPRTIKIHHHINNKEKHKRSNDITSTSSLIVSGLAFKLPSVSLNA